MVTKAAPKPTEETTEPPEGETQDKDKSATIADVERIVREAVVSVLGGGDKPTEGDPPTETSEAPPKNAKEEESRLEQLVSAAAAKILASAPPEKPSPKIPEEPPIKVRRAERFLWGSK